MKHQRYLIADADLMISHDSGSQISVRLKAGTGVVELNDNRLLHTAVKHFRTHRRLWHDMARYFEHVQQIKARIDFSVGGRRIGCLDSTRKADFICRYLGLPHCRVKPIALLISLISSQPHSRTN